MTTLTIIGLIILAAWGWAKSYVRGLGIKKMNEYAELAYKATEATLEMRDKQYKHIYKRFEEVSEELEAANAAINEKNMYIRTYKIDRAQMQNVERQKSNIFYELVQDYRTLAKDHSAAINIENTKDHMQQVERFLEGCSDKYEGRVKL